MQTPPAIPFDEALFEIVPAGVYVCDSEGYILRWNAKAEQLWGCAPGRDNDAERFCGAAKLFWSDGRHVKPEETPMVDVLRTGHPAYNCEFIVEQPNGNRIWVMANVNAVKNDQGKVVGAVNCFQDISARKHAENKLRDSAARSRTLVDELNHRVKNTLATVRSLIHLSFVQGCTPEAVAKLENRVQGLSIAHDLLTEGDWQGIGLRALIDREMRPFFDENSPRVTLDGPDCFLPPKIALSLTMAIHELITNALKFGSLSNPQGQLNVGWTVEPERAGTETLTIRWQEENGPPVAQPERRGFGLRMLQRGLPKDIDAAVSLDFRPQGLHAKLHIPLPPSRPV